MKKNVAIFLSFLLIFSTILLQACDKKQRDTNDITIFLKNMESYSTEMDMTVKNDIQEINYKAKQSYLRGEGYRLELNDERIFIYKDDDKIYIKDKHNGAKYTQSKDFDEVFKLSFIGEYIGLLYTNEEIKYSTKSINGIEYQVINLLIPGTNKNINNASMYVNIKSMLPEELIIYDNKGKEKIKIEYTKFLPNIKVDPMEFTVE